MKVLTSGDFHLGDKRNSLYLNGEFIKINETFNLMFELNNSIKNLKPDLVVFVGDILDSKILDVILVSKIIQWLNELDKLNIPIYIFPGNHESSAFKTSLDFIKEINYTNISFIGTVCSKEINNFNFIFIPFFNEKLKQEFESEEKAIQSNLTNNKNIVFSHLWMNGAFLNENSSEEWIDKKDLNLNQIDFFISGHIHKKQTFKKDKTIIHYPGSPLHLDFGDDPKDKKTFSMIDLSSNEITEFPVTSAPRKYYTYYVKTISDFKNFEINEKDYIKFKIPKTLKHELPIEMLNMKNIFWEQIPIEEIEELIKPDDISFEKVINAVIEKRDFEKEFKKELHKNLIRVKESCQK